MKIKSIFLIITLAFAVPVAVTTPGCASSPTTQNTAVQSLKAVGQTAEGLVALNIP